MSDEPRSCFTWGTRLILLQADIHRALPGVEEHGHQQPMVDRHLVGQEGEQITASVTGVSGLTASPVESSSARFPSTKMPPVESAPAVTGRLHVGSTTDNLLTQLDNALNKSPYDGKTSLSFLPRNVLESVINQDSVAEYCSTYAATILASQTDKIVEYVFRPHKNDRGLARQIFSILVLMDEPALIPGVVEEDIRDHDLPLALCEGNDSQMARRRDMLIEPISCFKDWTRAQRRNFDMIQFQVKAPVFNPLDRNFGPGPHRSHPSSTGGQHHQADDYVAENLDDRTVLPFTKYDGKAQIIAGSSKVVRVKIHFAHHGFNQDVRNFVSIRALGHYR